MNNDQTLKDEIKARYGQAALQAQKQERRSCCGTGTVLTEGKLDPITENLYGENETAVLPEEAVLASIRKTRCAVTAEEHNVIGGLGDAIGQLAARHFPIPIEYIGTNDTFGESGTPDQLLKKYGLDVPDIIAAAEKAMARKNG